MEWYTSEDLIAMAIGRTAMAYMDSRPIIKAVNSEAMRLLEEILELLNNDRLDDSDCYYKIDAIVSAFRQRGVDVYRHDFG